ncbi:MAG TPA: type I restriction-modification system subunit M [Bauldia sp.]|nr:type I restriction-modification system subunit M [Bauldia sp.]
MAEKTTLDDVKRIAWAACDTFRGVIDASEYKDFILVFLFLKYVSDVWKEHYQEADQRYEGDELRVARKMARERFVIPKGASFDDLHRQRNADNVGELIDQALDAIAEANKAKIGDAFADVMFNSETKLGDTKNRNRRLKSLIEDFAKLDLRPSRVAADGQGHKTAEDVIGEAYIYLIERFGSEAGKKAGEFYTPRQVARVLAKLAAPQPGDRICDPACGSGSLLIKAAEEIGTKDFALFGQEVNRGTWGLARLNMFLHGIDSARLEWGDTLNDPKLIDGASLMKFDVVVANPPFSLDKWGAENAEKDRFGRFFRGVPPKSKGDWAFITHMIEAAKTREGRVAVVVPHGVLFRGGKEGIIRKTVIEENLLDAVVGLPQNLFQTTSIPVAVLLFDRRREKGGDFAKRRDVVFIDASRDFQPGKNQNQLLDEHVDRIVNTHSKRKDVERYARKVPVAEIAENDFNLNIPRYVDTFEAPEEVDIAAVQKEIDSLEAELTDLRVKMRRHLKELGINV